MTLLLDFLRFIGKPDQSRLSLQGTPALLWTLGFYFLLLPLTLLAVLPANLWPSPETLLVDMLAETLSEPTLFMVFFLVFLGPFWEEMIFRYPLRFSLHRGVTAGVFLVSFLLMAVIPPEVPEVIQPLTPLILLGTAAFVSFYLPRWTPQLPWHELKGTGTGWGVWVHLWTFLFAQMHLLNYQVIAPEGWILAFFLNLPRWILGLGLSYVRIRLGVTWAIVMHIANNGFFLILFRIGTSVS